MNHVKYAIHAFAVSAMLLVLTGCGDSKQISEVKAMAFADTTMTVDNALDTRKICDSVKWSVFQDDRNQTTVQYECNYKGVDDSAFLQGDTPKIVTAGDVWQWTYDASGSPTMTGVSMVVRHDDGSVKEVISGGGAGMVLSKMISDNTVENYDQVFSIISARAIPVKSQAPAAPVADTQVAVQSASQPTSLGQAVASAQAAPDPLPIGSDDSDFPAMTPCLQRLEGAARKQAAAQGADDTINVDAANEMANTCKTLGQ